MTDQDPTSNDQTDLFNAGPVVETLNTELAAPVLGSVAIEGTEKVDELPAAETELSIETEAEALAESTSKLASRLFAMIPEEDFAKWGNPARTKRLENEEHDRKLQEELDRADGGDKLFDTVLTMPLEDTFVGGGSNSQLQLSDSSGTLQHTVDTIVLRKGEEDESIIELKGLSASVTLPNNGKKVTISTPAQRVRKGESSSTLSAIECLDPATMEDGFRLGIEDGAFVANLHMGRKQMNEEGLTRYGNRDRYPAMRVGGYADKPTGYYNSAAETLDQVNQYLDQLEAKK